MTTINNRIFHSFLYTLCFFCLALSSCNKTLNDTLTPVSPGNVFPIPAASPVNGTLSGRVFDENNTPVVAALIECAGISTNTDANGIFNIDNVSLDKYISTVTVKKAGYFKAYRSFSANADRNYVNIKLIPKILSGTFNSTVAQTITLSNTTEIRFQTNSITVKSTGAPYNGPVNVYASYIDPTSSDISQIVPGSFMARDANNVYVLQSAGMIAVDIESPSGEPLQLQTNKPASIRLPIPASLLSKAPQTIDTWSLDEQGVWKKETTAPRTGNYYDMQVTHFSFWNCDVPMNAIYLNLKVKDQNNINVPNTVVKLTVINSSGFWVSSYGTTDGSGNVSGMVPAAQELRLDLFPSSLSCATALYTQNIGPFTSNTSLTVTATLLPAQLLTVSGIANNCAGQPLQHGTALIYTGQYYQYANITNGNYSATLSLCTPITSLNVGLFDSSGTAQAWVGPVTVNGNTITIPTTSLCTVALNQYDGIYEITGSLTDFYTPLNTGDYPRQYHLISTGPNSVNVAQLINGFIVPGYSFTNSGGLLFYGNFGLQVFFNPATNMINEVRNYYGDPANPPTGVGEPATGSGPPTYTSGSGRSAVLNPTGLNNYNPATKVIQIKYDMMQPSVVPLGPRATITETMTYIGPR